MYIKVILGMNEIIVYKNSESSVTTVLHVLRQWCPFDRLLLPSLQVGVGPMSTRPINNYPRQISLIGVF